MRKIKFLSILLLTGALAIAQDSYLPFADFHIHPSYKHYNRPELADGMRLIYRSTRYDPVQNTIQFDSTVVRKFAQDNWTSYLLNKRSKKKALLKGKISDLRNYDQASYAEIKYTPGSLLCTSLYPFEKQYTLNWFKRWVNATIVTKMGKDRLNYYSKNEHTPLKDFMSEYFYTLMQDSVHYVINSVPTQLYIGSLGNSYIKKRIF